MANSSIQISHLGLIALPDTRADAQCAREVRYFTGEPCINRHVTWRWTSSTDCYACAIARRPSPNPRVKLPGTYYSRNRTKLIENAKPLTREQRDRANALARERRADDPERARQNGRRKHHANKEARNAQSRAHYAANAEQMRAHNKAWRAANPEMNRIYVARRRARIQDGRNDLTAADVAEITRLQGGRCAECREKTNLTIDHIIALSRDGEHTRRNVQMLCMPCNREKNAAHPIDFAKRRGRLL